MQKTSVPILEKLNTIERDLQELKVQILLQTSPQKRGKKIYDEENIVAEVKKIRKQLWNEKYPKAL